MVCTVCKRVCLPRTAGRCGLHSIHRDNRSSHSPNTNQTNAGKISTYIFIYCSVFHGLAFCSAVLYDRSFASDTTTHRTLRDAWLSNPSIRCDGSLRCVLHAFNTSRRTDISILFHFISFFFFFSLDGYYLQSIQTMPSHVSHL